MAGSFPVVAWVKIAVTISPCHELAVEVFFRRVVSWEVSLLGAGPFPVVVAAGVGEDCSLDLPMSRTCRGWRKVSFRRVVSWDVSLAAAGPFPVKIAVSISPCHELAEVGDRCPSGGSFLGTRWYRPNHGGEAQGYGNVRATVILQLRRRTQAFPRSKGRPPGRSAAPNSRPTGPPSSAPP